MHSKEGAEHMLENTFLIMTVIFLVALTVGFIWYMRGKVDNRDYVFYKIGLFLRYMTLKLEVGVGNGIASMESAKKNKQKEEGTHCPVVDMKHNSLRIKEYKLREMEEHLAWRPKVMKAPRGI